jgi:hypothetical protein
MSAVENSKDGGDLVWGAPRIAAVICRNERQTYHMLENGTLPAKRVGNRWVASRRKLLAALTGDDGAAT